MPASTALSLGSRSDYLKAWDPDELALVEERQTGLGGSDIPSLFGVGFNRTVTHIYYEKTRPIPLERDPPNIHMKRGRLLEPLAAARWQLEHGQKVMRVSLRRMRGHPHAIAHLDRKVVGESTGCEFKAPGVNSMWAQLRRGVWESTLLQASWYLGVTGWRKMWVGLISVETEPDWVCFPVTPDRELFGIMLERADRLWNDHIVPQIPPDQDDFQPIDRLPTQLLAPFVERKKRPPVEVDPATTDLDLVKARTLTKEAIELRRDRLETVALEKERKKELAALMSHLEEARDTDGLLFPEVGTVYHRWQNGSPNTDATLLRAAAPLDRDRLLRWLSEELAETGAVSQYRTVLTALQEAAVAGELNLDVESFISTPRYQALRIFEARRTPEEGEQDD